jgi:excisionase family DNA binding protein
MQRENLNNSIDRRLLSLKEAAYYLGRSIWSVRELIWKGALPYIQDGRKQYLDIIDLDRYIELHKKVLN